MSVVPAGPRISVTDPPVEEESPIWLPPSAAGLAGDLETAIVVDTGEGCDLGLKSGDRVFFHEGHFAKIGDVKIVAEDCILAFERLES